MPIRSVVRGPSNLDISTAIVIAGLAHLTAFCLPKVLGPTPTTTYEIATIKEIAQTSDSPLFELPSTKKVATRAVAVNSQLLRTKSITFKNLAGFSTKSSNLFL